MTLDSVRILSNAKENPDGFIESLKKPAIIDEVQRAPEISLPLKRDIDEQRSALLEQDKKLHGRYVLTGSANPLLLPILADALVGRMEIIKMYPLSQGEINKHQETFLDQLFSAKPKYKYKPTTRKKLCQLMTTGGYPDVQDLSEEERIAWFHSYIEAILQRDVKELTRIEGLAKIPDIFGLLALRASNLLNVSSLGRDAKVKDATLRRYLIMFEKMSLILLQPPWGSNLGDQYIKSPKVYFNDTGLLCYFMDFNADRLMDSPIIGKVLENFVLHEILKQISWSSMRMKCYHFRTESQIEVDILLERPNGEMVGIEVQASDDVTPADIEGLRYLQKTQPNKFVRGIVLYTGKEILPFEKNIHAIPISALWES